jgi:hypothetical protein
MKVLALLGLVTRYWLLIQGQAIPNGKPLPSVVATNGIKITHLKDKIVYQSTLPTFFKADWKVKGVIELPNLVLVTPNYTGPTPSALLEITEVNTTTVPFKIELVNRNLTKLNNSKFISSNRLVINAQDDIAEHTGYERGPYGPPNDGKGVKVNIRNRKMMTRREARNVLRDKRRAVQDLRYQIRRSMLNTTLLEETPFYIHSSGEMMPTLSRQKRGILSFCCDVAYQSDLQEVKVDEERIEDYMKMVKFSLTGEQQEISNLQHTVTNLNSAVEDDMKILKKDLWAVFLRMKDENVDMHKLVEVQTHLIDSLNFLLMQSEYTHRNISVAECRSKHIPHLIVTMNLLRDRIQNISRELFTKNSEYELAIPKEKYGTYYKHELASCLVSNDSMMIQIKIPLKKKKTEWILYSVDPMAFAYNNSICHFEGLPSFIAVSSERQVRSLNPSHYHHCTQSDFSLCYLPQFPQQYQYNEKCMTSLFFGSSMKQITTYCKFMCTKTTTPVITQISAHEFSILNPSYQALTLSVTCENETSNYQDQISAIGSYTLNLPCRCKASVTNRVAVYEQPYQIRAPYPCIVNATTVIRTALTIPIYWLKEKSYFVHSDTHQYLSLHDGNLTDLLESDLSHLHGIDVQDQLDKINVTLALQNLEVPKLFNMNIRTTSWVVYISILIAYFLLWILIYLQIRMYCCNRVPHNPQWETMQQQWENQQLLMQQHVLTMQRMSGWSVSNQSHLMNRQQSLPTDPVAQREPSVERSGEMLSTEEREAHALTQPTSSHSRGTSVTRSEGLRRSAERERERGAEYVEMEDRSLKAGAGSSCIQGPPLPVKRNKHRSTTPGARTGTH